MTDLHTEHDIAGALEHVRGRIDMAATRAGRNPSEVTLVAVSKTFPAAAVRAAILAGQRDFGENRVEEAGPKIREIGEERREAGSKRQEARGQTEEVRSQRSEVRWHLIGHLQSRKVKDAIGQFDLIHSVDSVKLATAIDQRIQSRITDHGSQLSNAHAQQLLLECNVSGEASKSGFAVAGWEENRAVRDAFMRDVEQIARLPNVRLRGLMTIAPIAEAGRPDQARAVFASLRELREALRSQFPQRDFPHVAWDHLSMGMSDDFEVAIAEGATLVRLGRAIFGERTYV